MSEMYTNVLSQITIEVLGLVIKNNAYSLRMKKIVYNEIL